MEQLQELEKILTKDPVIHTFEAEEIRQNPRFVDETYTLHAETHMPLGNTSEYVNRMLTCLLKNKTTFVGGVVGDYGLGKTSLLAYFWKQCENNDVIAVPPYVWFTFQENFQAIYSWTKYKLEQRNLNLIPVLDTIYSKYRDPSVENRAKLYAQNFGVDYERARRLIQQEFEAGNLKLDFDEQDLLDFCSEIEKLIQEAHFKGLMIFTDELQETIVHNSQNYVASLLFNLCDKLVEGRGHFGFFFGMPLTTQTGLIDERSDIFDRLAKFGCYINLSEMYGQDFPERLWDLYANNFDFEEIKHEIVTEETLQAIGQICDSRRRDLGNGPRSVISTFNRMVWWYKNKELTYTPIDFVNDCIGDNENNIKEITLGEQSTFAARVSDVLAMPNIRGEYDNIVKVLAAFPQGCPNAVLTMHGLEAKVESLIRDTEYGRVVYETANGYALTTLREAEQADIETVVERRIRRFYTNYSAGKQDAQNAMAAFRQFIIPKLFPEKQGQQIAGWVGQRGREWEWKQTPDGLWATSIIGTYESTQKYPERKVALILAESHSGDAHVKAIKDHDFTFKFVLQWDNKNKDFPGKIVQASDDNRVFLFVLNMMYSAKPLQIPLTRELVPSNITSPLFLLALMKDLNDFNIPKSEEDNRRHILNTLTNDLTVSLLNEHLLTIENADIQLNNKGSHIVSDLFFEICEKSYPHYSTLIRSPRWESKLGKYIAVLQREGIPLNIKRGVEFWHEGGAPRDSRKLIAEEFGVPANSFKAWATELDNLLDLSHWDSEGALKFRTHPLEKLIVDEIDNCPDEERIPIEGKRCRFINAVDMIDIISPLGYTLDEIRVILGKLGVARKYFNYDERRGIVYRMPVSLEELREELYEKLEGVYTEIDNLEAVEGFSLQSVGINVNLAEVSQRIEKLSNDEEFEELKHLLHGCFERNHRWIGTKLVEFKGQLDQMIKPVKNGFQSFERSGSLRLLDKKIEGQAIWIMDLANVQANLKQNFSEIKAEWSKVERGIDSIKNKMDQLLGDRVEIAKSGAEKLYEFQCLIREKRVECEEVQTNLKVLGDYIEAYRHWWELITLSDNVASTVLSIKMSLGESRFVTDFERISGEIKEHLQRRNKDALPNYESFTRNLETLRSECHQFTKGLREAFNAERDALNRLLADVGASVSGLRTTFNTDEPQVSYDELYREAVDGLKQAVEQLTDDFRNLSNELNYSANILGKTVEVGENNLLLQTKHATTEATNLLTSDLLEFVSAIRTNPDGLLPLKESITNLREVYREVKKHHRAILQPEEPTTNESKLLEVLERNEKDLKEVILQYAESSEGELNLDVVLDCLKGLFVKNQIMMRVRRI